MRKGSKTGIGPGQKTSIQQDVWSGREDQQIAYECFWGGESKGRTLGATKGWGGLGAGFIGGNERHHQICGQKNLVTKNGGDTDPAES